MTSVVEKRLAQESLSGSWLSSRLGIGTHRLDAMRRAGELLGVRLAGRQDYYYPSWQFASDGKPLAAVQRIVAAARANGLSDERLYEVLTSRSGLSGTERLADALREGRDAYVLQSVRGVRA